MRHVSDAERRARLGVRHALAAPVPSPAAAVDAVAALHATEPASPYLSCFARVDGFTVADLDGDLYGARDLVKQLAMRRTLFVFPRSLLPAVWPSASARVAGSERSRMAKDVVAAGLAADGLGWLDEARASVLSAVAAAPAGLTAAQVRQAVPMVDVKIVASAVSAAARVLTHLGLTADVVRGENTGRWATSRPRWTSMASWLGSVPPWRSAADGYRELVRRWLYSFGPGTEDDLVWWLGATKAVVRAALAELAAVPVGLDGGGTGWLLPSDLAEVAAPDPWVALLPVLDPTVMGWQHRSFYLGPHKDLLFDRNGNAGTTAWVDGRLVGCWTQDAAGTVAVHLVERVPAAARRALDAEARRLTSWLAGLRIGTVYSSPAMKAAAG